MVSGTLPLETFLRAHETHRGRTRRGQMIFSGGCILLGVPLFFTHGFSFTGELLFAMGAAGLLTELLLAKRLLRSRMTRIYNQQAALNDTFTYSWDEENVYVSASTGQGKRPWKHYVKVTEAEDLFLLYHSDHMFEIVPKSWFTDTQQIEEFRSLTSVVGT